MSIHDFWTPKPGDVTKGGTVRAPGENEPEILKSAEKEAKARELAFVRDLLAKNNFTTAEVLNNDNLMTWAEKELRRGLQGYLFGTAEEHIRILDSERKKALKIKK